MRSISIDFDTPLGVTLTIVLMQHAPNSFNMGVMWTKKDGEKMLEERALPFDEFDLFWETLADLPPMPRWENVSKVFAAYINMGAPPEPEPEEVADAFPEEES